MWSYNEVVAQTGFYKAGSNVSLPKAHPCLSDVRSRPTKAKTFGISNWDMSNSMWFEYNPSVLSSSMTYSTAHQWSVEILCWMGGRGFAGRSGVARDSINRCSVCVDLSCFSVIGSLCDRFISVLCVEPHSSISAPKCVSRLTAFL